MLLSAGAHAAVFAVPAFEWRIALDPGQVEPARIVAITEALTLPAAEPRPAIPRPATPVAPTFPDLAFAEIAVPRLDFPPLRPVEIPAPPVAVNEFADYVKFLPTMVMPFLKNRAVIQRELRRRYLDRLRAGGVEGRLYALLWIDEQGLVRNHEIEHTPGSEAFHRAVSEVIPLMRFTPSLKYGEPVRSIVRVPIDFRLR